jgi:hypothetical protein
MSKITLSFAFSLLVFFLFSTVLWKQSQVLSLENISDREASNRQISYQENLIDLSSKELQHPLLLKIEASDVNTLSGQITIGDRTIATLKNNLIVDLSSWLHFGTNTIEIIGRYQPKNNSITVDIKGRTINTTTSSGGSGILQQKLIINVF